MENNYNSLKEKIINLIITFEIGNSTPMECQEFINDLKKLIRDERIL